ELMAINTINDAGRWSGAASAPFDAFLKKLGADGTEHVRLLGTMTDESVAFYLNEASQEGDNVIIPPIQVKAIQLAHRATQLACGLVKPMKEQQQAADQARQQQQAAAERGLSDALAVAQAAATAAQAAQAAASSHATAPQAKPGGAEFETVINQTWKGSIQPLGPEEVKDHFANYRAVFGDKDPPAGEECNPIQLGGLKSILAGSGAPYLDFGVWGPNHHRLLRRIRFSGARFGAGGVLETVELLGPANLHSWEESYRLVITGMVGFKAVDLGNLLNYGKKIKEFFDLYGQECWALIYQADVRARLEEMERLRRTQEEKYARVTARGEPNTTKYDPDRPWNSVWAAMVDHDKFWSKEIERPCQLYLSRISPMHSFVDGDAPVGGTPGASVAPRGGGGEARQAKRPAGQARGSEGRKVKPRFDKSHRVVEGCFTHNRRDIRLCADFQKGQCTQVGPGGRCARDPRAAHQCAKCLDQRHGAFHPKGPVPNDALMQSAQRPRVLVLSGDADSLGARLDELGCCADTRRVSNNGGVHDIREDIVFEGVLEEIRCGTFAAVHLEPPRTTFDVSVPGPRAEGRGGARKRLRGCGPPEIYGLRGLTPQEKDGVRGDTLLAIRSFDIGRLCSALGIPWGLRSPAQPPGSPSMFALPEAESLMELAGVGDVTIGVGPQLSSILRGSVPAAGFPSAVASVEELHQRLAEDPKQRRRAEDEQPLGGLRNAADAVAKINGHCRLGPLLRQYFDKFLDRRPDVEHDILLAVSQQASGGAAADHRGPCPSSVDTARRGLQRILQAESGCEIDTGVYSTCIRGHLLHRWAKVAGDPGADAARWLWEGAPAGLEADTAAVDKIFPRPEAPLCPGMPRDTYLPPEEFENYASFDRDAEAAEEVKEFVSKGYLHECDTLQQLREYLGAEPVISRFAVRVRERHGKIKRRLILDLRQSGVTSCTRQTHRVPLPRGSDAVRDVLTHMAAGMAQDGRAGGEDIEFSILDFVDAFWNIPLLFEERRHFVGRVGHQYLVYQRAAQGSRNGPLAWAGVASLLVRCTQSLFMQPAADVPRAGPTARLQLYVDVNWIGCKFTISSDAVVVTISKEKCDELQSMVVDYLGRNVLPIKELRSFIGLASHFASVIWVWRPFLSELWAALKLGQEEQCGDAPKNCIWTKMVRHTLCWLLAFMRRVAGSMNIVYRADAFLNRGPKLRIVGNASPWGMGAFLMIDGRILEWYATPIGGAEAAILGHAVGSHLGQQTWETLNLLIGLRTWKSHWQQARVTVEVRSDNASALTMVGSLRGRGAATNLLARELALDLGGASFKPDFCVHSPGVACKIVGALSRKYEPGVAPSRKNDFFHALDNAAAQAAMGEGAPTSVREPA
ncbi:unnamed protein product, partial [Prorocentrum cordatum]